MPPIDELETGFETETAGFVLSMRMLESGVEVPAFAALSTATTRKS